MDGCDRCIVTMSSGSSDSDSSRFDQCNKNLSDCLASTKLKTACCVTSADNTVRRKIVTGTDYKDKAVTAWSIKEVAGSSSFLTVVAGLLPGQSLVFELVATSCRQRSRLTSRFCLFAVCLGSFFLCSHVSDHNRSPVCVGFV
jgi:hypothetical protein